MTVLVTDGEQRSALAAVRALGKAGLRVAVAGRHPCLAGVSRWCAVRVCGPSARDDREGFLAAVIRAAHEHDAVLIIPASDAAAFSLSQARALLPAFCTLPLPAHDELASAMDRLRLLALAGALGVAAPRTWQKPERGVPLPAVVKPASGRFDARGRWLRPDAVAVNSRAELEQACARLAESGLAPVIQDYVPGEGWGVFALCRRGEALAVFAHRRVREKPPDGGVSVVRESVACRGDMEPGALRLLEALEWTGPAMVEFRRDARDGSFRLMEINPRIWGSLQLAVDCGMDFPRMIFDLIVLGQRPRATWYRVGARSRWLMGDVDYLSIMLRRGNGDRMSALASFFARGQGRCEIERADDPLPALHEKAAYVADALRGAARRILAG